MGAAVRAAAKGDGPLGLLLFAGLYLVAALAPFALFTLPGLAPLWIANAIALAALLRSRRSRWAGMIAAFAAGNAAMGLIVGRSWPEAACLTTANVVEYTLCALLIGRSWPTTGLGARRRRLVLVSLGLLAVCLASASFAGVSLCIVAGRDPGALIRGWLLAHPLSLFVFTPCAMILTSTRLQLRDRPPTWRAAAALGVLMGLDLLVFSQAHAPILFVIPPALLGVAIESGALGAAVGILATTLVAIYATVHGSGPIVLMHGDLFEKGAVLQLFLATLLVVSLPVARMQARQRRLQAETLAEARRAAAAEAAAAVAAEAKSQFLANMSHELRTPLTAVIGFADLLAEQGELSPASRRYVERVRTAGKGLLATVNDVLDFSRLEVGQVEICPWPTDLAALAEEVGQLFAAQAAAKALTLRLDIDPALPSSLELDPDRIRQVLTNLLANAVKFTDAGEVALRLSYAGGRLEASVADTGPGIPAERLPLLFQRFSQVDGSNTRRHGGTGLGLAICKGLVEAMGGTIGVTSAPGAGSTFAFSLPAAAIGPPARSSDEPPSDEPTSDDGPGWAAVGGGAGRRARLLVAEDNLVNRELVRALLARGPLEVETVADGEAAVEAAATGGYDLILMDLHMPGMGGREAMRRIRGAGGRAASTPILAFSADAPEQALGGFDGLVAKPIVARELIDTLDRWLAPRAADHEAPCDVAA